jgi:hypothetical protein
MSSRIRSSSGISENSIVFFEGGHNHNGVSSSLIDTEQYSIYDFIVGKTGSNSRQIRQQRNFDNLKTVVSNIVINDVLGPSGVRLLPNSVQSVHIQAGAITANELAANIVLINNVISSNNYVLNTSGWAIYSNGTAEFDAASIRGTLTAGAVVINNDNYWYSNGLFRVGSNSEFMSFNGSDLSVTGDVTTGNLTATGGRIAGFDIGVAGNPDALFTGGTFTGNLILGRIDGSSTSTGDQRGGARVNGAGAEFAEYYAQFAKISNTSGTTTIVPGSITTGTVNADLNGNASTADLATTALNADRLDNYLVSYSDVIETVVVRGNDASIRGQYLVMTTGNTGGTTELRIRNDGYIFLFGSRRELKNTIENVNSNFALSIINSLQPVSFRMNEPQYIGDLFSEREATYREYGFIAQDVAEVDANLATYGLNAEGDEVQPQAWSSHTMISLSVAAIQGLVSEVNELKSRVAQLEQRG